MRNAEESIERLNDLLRGELSAVETYELALGRFQAEPVGAILQDIRDDHADTAARLQRHVHELGAQPVTSSGAWGLFVKSIEGAARLFGENSALAALLEGEELGQAAYEDLLMRDGHDPRLSELIRQTLLPRQKRHVSTLRGLMAKR